MSKLSQDVFYSGLAGFLYYIISDSSIKISLIIAVLTFIAIKLGWNTT